MKKLRNLPKQTECYHNTKSKCSIFSGFPYNNYPEITHTPAGVVLHDPLPCMCM